MHRRYAYNLNDNYKKIRIDEEFLKGYACHVKFENVDKPLVVFNGEENICIRDNGYEWIKVYPDNDTYQITIMYDNNNDIIEWYFDVAKEIGLENGVPYEDDLYLDMVITKDMKKIVVDENELMDALHNNEITQEDVSSAYETLKKIENKYANNLDELLKLTDYLNKKFDRNINIK